MLECEPLAGPREYASFGTPAPRRPAADGQTASIRLCAGAKVTSLERWHQRWVPSDAFMGREFSIQVCKALSQHPLTRAARLGRGA